jgi:hypothetical protein
MRTREVGPRTQTWVRGSLSHTRRTRRLARLAKSSYLGVASSFFHAKSEETTREQNAASRQERQPRTLSWACGSLSHTHRAPRWARLAKCPYRGVVGRFSHAKSEETTHEQDPRAPGQNAPQAPRESKGRLPLPQAEPRPGPLSSRASKGARATFLQGKQDIPRFHPSPSTAGRPVRTDHFTPGQARMHGPSSYRASKQERGRAPPGVPTPTPPRQPAKEYNIRQKKETRGQKEKAKIRETKSRKIKPAIFTSDKNHLSASFLPTLRTATSPCRRRPQGRHTPLACPGRRREDDQAARAKTLLAGKQEHSDPLPPGQARTHRPLCYRASKTLPPIPPPGQARTHTPSSSRASKSSTLIFTKSLPSPPTGQARTLGPFSYRATKHPVGNCPRARAASRINDAFLPAASALPRLACPGRDVGTPSARKIRPRPAGAQGAGYCQKKKIK